MRQIADRGRIQSFMRSLAAEADVEARVSRPASTTSAVTRSTASRMMLAHGFWPDRSDCLSGGKTSGGGTAACLTKSHFGVIIRAHGEGTDGFPRGMMTRHSLIPRSLIVCIVALLGCGVSREQVLEDLAAARREIVAEIREENKATLERIQSEFQRSLAKIDSEFAKKSDLEAALKNGNVRAASGVEERLKQLSAEVAAVAERLDRFRPANEGEVVKLMDTLLATSSTLWKMLQQQKDGIEKALRELERIGLPAPEKAPPPPPAEEKK